jgi:hypothetical protein
MKRRKEISTYDQWEAALDRQIETVFARQQRKNPHVGFYAQLDAVFRMNSPWAPLVLQIVEYVYDLTMEKVAAAAEDDE